MTIVIAGFPGIGKSYFKENHLELKVVDSDSSSFSKDPWFPLNYMNHLKTQLKSADVVLISTHKVVRQALEFHKIEHIIVVPEASAVEREHYLQRYRDRGSSEQFISLINDNWYDWLVDIGKGSNVHTLAPGEYLEDAWQNNPDWWQW